MNRLSAVLLALLGVLAGYALNGPSTSARVAGPPVNLGDNVILFYEPGANVAGEGDRIECSVAEIRGNFVKCAPPSRVTFERNEDWRSLRRVVHIVRRER